MKYTIVFSQLASDDLTEILGWYKSQDAQLSSRYITEMSTVLRRMEDFPEIFPFEYLHVRKAILRKFPYKVLYFVEHNTAEVHIIAVVHQSRHPDFWKKRI